MPLLRFSAGAVPVACLLTLAGCNSDSDTETAAPAPAAANLIVLASGTDVSMNLSGAIYVNSGKTLAVSVTAPANHLLSVGGTCPAGAFQGSTYTTGVVTANCTVTFGSKWETRSITASGDGHLILSPGTVHEVSYGSAQSFTLTPDAGYRVDSKAGGTCPAGDFTGNTYTTGAITADCTVTFASNPPWAGLKHMGVATRVSTANGTTLDSDGNVYVTGQTNGALNGSPLTGTADAFVAKYNWSGELVWLKLLGAASASTTAWSVAVDGEGTVYVSGNSNRALPGNVLTSGNEAFVASFAADGTLRHVNQASSSGHDSKAIDLAIDRNGDVLVLGFANGSVNWRGIAGSPQGTVDYFVGKLAPDLSVMWLQQVGAPGGTLIASKVAVDQAGDVFVAGSTDQGLSGNSQIGTRDAFVSKHQGTSGTEQWLRQMGAPGVSTENQAIAVDGAGNVFVGGSTQGGLNGNTLTGVSDAILAKYDALSGSLSWVRQFGSASETTTAYSVGVDPTGNVFLAGVTTGPLAGQPVIGTVDSFISKYDSNGTPDWLRLLGAPGAQTYAARDVATDPEGNLFAAGYTTGNLPGMTVIGQRDYLISKYSADGTLQ